MALRKRGVTFLICFRKRAASKKGGFPQKRGVPALEETMKYLRSLVNKVDHYCITVIELTVKLF